MVINKLIYLDYAATTPVHEKVLQAMLPYFQRDFGNPSSIHAWGQEAEGAVEKSRLQISRFINANESEIIFTSCGTESDNLALKGASLAKRKMDGANKILISPVEHHAVSHTAQQLRDIFGFELEFISVDKNGMLDVDDLIKKIDSKTAIVSIIYGNNEIGTINPIKQIGQCCRERNVIFHTDAVQAAAHLPIDVVDENIDLLSIGAHKFYGPKGVGALYCRKNIPLIPLVTGGKQERGIRAGTHNVPYIVGMAEATQIMNREREKNAAKNIELRDLLIDGVMSNIKETKLTGHPTQRLSNHASFVFQGVDGNLLLILLDRAGYACSSGSACKTGNPESSEVLQAIGLSKDWSFGSLRVTLGVHTTRDEIESFIHILPSLVKQAKK
jgi:cysteine desulfurase